MADSPSTATTVNGQVRTGVRDATGRVSSQGGAQDWRGPASPSVGGRPVKDRTARATGRKPPAGNPSRRGAYSNRTGEVQR
jgi:hypothetical protein